MPSPRKTTAWQRSNELREEKMDKIVGFYKSVETDDCLIICHNRNVLYTTTERGYNNFVGYWRVLNSKGSYGVAFREYDLHELFDVDAFQLETNYHSIGTVGATDILSIDFYLEKRGVKKNQKRKYLWLFIANYSTFISSSMMFERLSVSHKLVKPWKQRLYSCDVTRRIIGDLTGDEDNGTN